MNKPELVAAVAEQLGMTKKDTEKMITCTFDAIADTMARGEKVQIAGFGSFETKERSARMGRNPKTGEPVEIPAGKAPVFKAGKGLKDKVAE